MNRSQTLKNNTIIDTRILPIQESKILFEFFDFLKKRAEKNRFKRAKKRINFQSWALNSKSKLTRKEIYDRI